MILDTPCLLETQRRCDAFQRYCHAFSEEMQKYPQKPYGLAFSDFGVVGREKYDGPLVFKIFKTFCVKCGHKKMTNQGKEITSVKFREGECTQFEPDTGDEE